MKKEVIARREKKKKKLEGRNLGFRVCSKYIIRIRFYFIHVKKK